ncbi:MAG: sirohydrochlorin cobaltochelatase [Prevotella sp.]|jgi:sirohydrochlorin cobaltochelatase
MKTIKFLMIAAMAMIVSASFTACSSDSDDSSDNKSRYQEIVDNTVKAQKKSNKALLLVAFGSTWQNAFVDFDATIDAYKKAFPGHDVYFSFSSAICRNRAAAGEHKDDGAEIRNYYAPDIWLEALGRVQYADITVQSLQVIPGEEYASVVACLKGFANNANNDLDNNYLKNVKLHMGTPLMANPDEDVQNLATELHKIYAEYANKGAMLFMGHGNPDDLDIYSANIRYTQLEQALQEKNKNYFVGTVDMMDNFKTNVLERMKAAGYTSGKVFCAPLMSIAGDHANNDMAGDDAEWELNEETGEYEETSWKVFFSETEKMQNGYDCNDETMIVKGLLSYPSVRQLWINHTMTAVDSEPLDWYHSNDGTE